MIITEVQLQQIEGAANVLLELSEAPQTEEYMRTIFSFCGYSIDRIIEEIKNPGE